MSKFIFYNDTGKDIGIHPATFSHGTTANSEIDIEPCTTRMFTVPEGKIPWVKMWNYGGRIQILVSHTTEEEV